MKIRQPKRSPNFNKPGYTVELAGFVTQLVHLVNKPSHALETSLGFNKGRLSGGWALYVLVEGVAAIEFEYAGSTQDSGGVAYDESTTLALRKARMIAQDETMPVPVSALLRSGWHARTGSDFSYDEFLAYESVKLMERKGLNRIAKCVPLDHGTEYPNAPFDSVPQWRLLCPKKFKCVAVLNPGQTYFDKTHASA